MPLYEEQSTAQNNGVLSEVQTLALLTENTHLDVGKGMHYMNGKLPLYIRMLKKFDDARGDDMQLFDTLLESVNSMLR